MIRIIRIDFFIFFRIMVLQSQITNKLGKNVSNQRFCHRYSNIYCVEPKIRATCIFNNLSGHKTINASHEETHQRFFNHQLMVRLFPLSLAVYFFNAEVAGPLITAPSIVNFEPWQGQGRLLLVLLNSTVQPEWVHTFDKTT